MSRELLQHNQAGLMAVQDCCKTQPGLRPCSGLLTGEPRKGTTASGGLPATHKSCGQVFSLYTKVRMRTFVSLAQVCHLSWQTSYAC